jgi:hypothetical protein
MGYSCRDRGARGFRRGIYPESLEGKLAYRIRSLSQQDLSFSGHDMNTSMKHYYNNDVTPEERIKMKEITQGWG